MSGNCFFYRSVGSVKIKLKTDYRISSIGTRRRCSPSRGCITSICSWRSTVSCPASRVLMRTRTVATGRRSACCATAHATSTSSTVPVATARQVAPPTRPTTSRARLQASSKRWKSGTAKPTRASPTGSPAYADRRACEPQSGRMREIQLEVLSGGGVRLGLRAGSARRIPDPPGTPGGRRWQR